MPKNGTIRYKKYHKKTISRVSAIRIFCCPDSPVTEVIIREPMRITTRHLGSIKKTARRLVKKQGRLFRIDAPFWPITAKPAQIRMGKGKGAVSYWAGRLKAGTSITSFKRINVKVAYKVLSAVSTKVSARSKVFNNTHLLIGRNGNI
jgi:ribosomal protein L16/L10AE